MNIIEIGIDEIKADLNQPRKYLDEAALAEMAVSIKNEGLINPIEVDENFIIITGELRWRASKIAGLKKVPIKILEKITDQNRFIRQVQENIHQNIMAPLDMANALDKIRKLLAVPAAQTAPDKFHKGQFFRSGVRELHNLLGMPESTISRLLDLLGTTGELREALKDPTFQASKVASIKEAPEKYQKELEHVVATQKDIPRDTVRHIVQALKKADGYGEDDSAKKLLKQNFEGLGVVEAVKKINKIVPDEESRLKEPADALKFISEKIVEFMEFLENHPLESFDNFHQPLVRKDIIRFGFYLRNFARGGKIKSEMKLFLENKK